MDRNQSADVASRFAEEAFIHLRTLVLCRLPPADHSSAHEPGTGIRKRIMGKNDKTTKLRFTRCENRVFPSSVISRCVLMFFRFLTLVSEY